MATEAKRRSAVSRFDAGLLTPVDSLGGARLRVDASTQLRPDRQITSQDRCAIPFQHARPGVERATNILRCRNLLRLETLLVCQRFADNAEAEDIGIPIIMTRLPTGSAAEKNIHIGLVPRAEAHANADLVRLQDEEPWFDRAQHQAVALCHGPKYGGNIPGERLDQLAS